MKTFHLKHRKKRMIKKETAMGKKELLQAMLEALIKDESEEASSHLHNYLSLKTNNILLGEEDDEEEEEKEDDDDKDDDEDDEDDDEDDEDEGSKKKGKKDKDDVKEEGLSHSDSYEKNEKGEAYHAVPHKDNSRGYGHNKSKAKSTKGLKGIGGDTGASTNQPNAYKTKPHKDNSRGVKSEDKGTKGLKQVSGNSNSPHSDGKKVNRRTDKTAKYHGTERGGKAV